MRVARPSLTVINFPELRAVVPYLSGSARDTAVRKLVSGIDADVGRVMSFLKSEKLSNRTTYVLTSDGAEAALDIRSSLGQIDRAVVAAGGSSVYTDPGEATMVGLQDTLQGQPAAQAIQDEHVRGIDALYYKMRAGSTWSYTPWYLDPSLRPSFTAVMNYELSTMAGTASPDVVVVGTPHAGFAPASMGASTLGAQWDTQHVPLVIAGHGVNPGVTSDFPARLVDVAPTVAALMGMGTPNGDGVILADAMQESPDGAARAQESAGTNLRLYVSALQARERQTNS
jgi:arylsulfatase A-like enzyme